MGSWILENTVIALGLTAVVAIVCRFNQRRPALCHFLWLLVLVALVAPPLPRAAESSLRVRGAIRSFVAAVVPAPKTTALPALPLETLGDDMFASTTNGTATEPASTGYAPASLSEGPSELHPLFGIGLFLWGAGVLWMLLREGGRIRRFADHVRTAQPANSSLERSIARVAEEMRVQAPPVRVLDGVGSPSVWCLGRPVLLWPSDRADRIEPALIAHELAHLARRDHWVARFELLCRLFFFWHPLFWFARRRVHEYAELSCDAWALWAYPADRRAFAGALIDVQEGVARAPIALQGLCATNTEFRNFEKRLCMIMKTRVTRKVSKSAAAFALVATALVLPGYGGEGKDEMHEYVPRKTVGELVMTKKLSGDAEYEFKAKRYEKAIALFEQVLEIDPKNGKALARLGYMHIGLGDLESARECFEYQLKLGHETSTAAYNLACTESLAGDTKMAQKRLKQAVRLGFTNSGLMAKDPDLEAIRGSAAHTECVAQAEKVALLKEKLLWAEKNDAEKAQKVRGALAQIVQDDGELLDKHGIALLSHGDYEAAAKSFARQAELGHETARAHYNLACSLALLGDEEGALKNLKYSLKKGMTNGEVMNDKDLASLHGNESFEWIAEKIAAPAMAKKEIEYALKTADHAQAAELLESALAAGRLSKKGNGWVLYKLGQSQHELGRYKAALASYERALANQYKVGDVAFGIASTLASAGDHDGALLHLDHAVELGFSDVAAMKKAGVAWKVSEEHLVKLLERAEKSAEKKAYEEKVQYEAKQKKTQEVAKKRAVY